MRTTYGLLRIGDAQVALPLTVLREVIPCPQELAPIPARAPGLRGAVNLRDVVIPVLDLAGALNWPVADREHPVIVIISTGGRMLGVMADKIDGITSVPDDQRHDTRDTGDDLVFSHTFGNSETGAVVSILDAEAILGMPGVPTVAEPAAGRTAAPEPAGEAVTEPRPGRPMLLVRCGGFRLAVSLTDIHTVLPQLVVADSPLRGELCRGVTAYMQDLVPVVDLLQALGLGSPVGADGAQGLLWRFPDGLVALQVSEVVEIVTLDDAQVRPLPALGVPNAGRFRGAVMIPGHGQHLVIDPGGLTGDETLQALGRLNTAQENTQLDRPAGGAEASNSYLTYRAGVEMATPLDQIAEILAYPDDFSPLPDTGTGLIGLFTHRDSVVSLLCLNRLIGRQSDIDPSTSRVLLVEHDGNHIGYVVNALGAIEQSAWEQEDETTRPGTPGRLADSPLVQFGMDPDGRLLPRVDLAGWAVGLS
ncbi:chemotaxis protein CheW [Actinoplanes sp. CA-015351]|uniref:chemotaxis protein CheW n=1 Tax=Actinoplanes sp. CA-015351 TaxID=3239897 RepID=UPI003D98C293